jgi:hypothetical protein
MPSKKQKIILTICLSLFLFAPLFASAAGLVPCGGYSTDSTKPCTVKDIFVILARVTNFLIAMAGVFAVYEIVMAGFYMVISAGNEEAITKRKEQITSAVIGLVLVMMSYMFINTVVNFMLTRDAVTDPKNPNYNAKCRFDLGDPLNYLIIDTSKCGSVPK